MTRRTLLLAPLALCAQSQRPTATVEWIESPILPESFRREAVVFPRAYTCCPDSLDLARRALASSHFPHSFVDNEPTLTDFFDAGDTITIMTTYSSDRDNSPFDRSVRVPLGIRWPGRLAPRQADELLVSHADVLPTLFGLTGTRPPAGLQGRDLSRQLVERRGEIPEAVYSEGRLRFVDEWRMLVRGFDKVIWNRREEVTGLYNLAEDPYEGTDLKDKREYELTRDSMMALARSWMRRLTDGMNPAGLRIRQ